MTRFRFRLERLLRLRERREQERAQLLGEALRAEELERVAVEQARAHLERLGDQLGRDAHAPQPAGMLQVRQMMVAAAAEQMTRAEDSHRHASAQVEQQQDQFREARKERRVVERLRERREEVWHTETARAEQMDQDEIARRRREGGERQ